MNDALRDSALTLMSQHTAESLEAAYIGEFENVADAARYVWEFSNPHLSAQTWPYVHIDWHEATADWLEQGAVVVIDKHYFDPTP